MQQVLIKEVPHPNDQPCSCNPAYRTHKKEEEIEKKGGAWGGGGGGTHTHTIIELEKN